MNFKKKLVIITGLSGSGKSLAIDTFEDLNYFCIDNLPPKMILQAIELWKPCSNAENLAIVVDVRARNFFSDLLPIIKSLKENMPECFDNPLMLFLNTSDAELIKRFKETRRKHPLVNNERNILDAISLERQMLADLSEHADKTIDTTNLEPEGIRRLIREFFDPSAIQERLMIAVVSFGFKHGVPLDADVVFDVRFLVNPYWQSDLRNLNGTHKEVSDFVMADPLTQPLMDKLFDLIEFSIPQYIREGKAYLTIAIGCTGGKHRSVVVAKKLNDFLKSQNYNVRLEHRDLLQARGQTDAR